MAKLIRALLQRPRFPAPGAIMRTIPIRIGAEALTQLRVQYVRLNGSTRGLSRFLTEKVVEWARELEKR